MTTRKVAAGVAVAVLICITGCGNPQGTTAATVERSGATSTVILSAIEERAQSIESPAALPHAGLIDPASVDPADPAAVAIAVVTTINQWDTTTDTSRLDATRRAEPWIAPTLLDDILAAPTRNDAAWTTLAQHRGYSTVDQAALANEYGQPPNTTTTANIQISYHITETGRDGWRKTDNGPLLARIQLSRTSVASPWLVSRFLAS